MKKPLFTILLCISILYLTGCFDTKHSSTTEIETVYTDITTDSVNQNTSTHKYDGGIGDGPHFDNPIFLDETVKYTDRSYEEKLIDLNNIKTQEIVSAFVLMVNSGVWGSFEAEINTSPDVLSEVIDSYLPADKNYELFEGDIESLGEYSAYVIFTDATGNEFTLFSFDYDLLTNEAFIPCAVVAYDGDYFLIRDMFLWRSLMDIDVRYTKTYN